MKYIVIEQFPLPFICTNENGEAIIFDDILEANKYAEDCQCGKVVKIKTF